MRAGLFLVGAIGVAVAGCAGRDPQPIATVQPQDVSSDCAMINAEIQANNKRAESLAAEQNGKVAQNVAAGVVGVVIWPMWFAMDTKGAAGTEAAALQARQEYLANLAAQRCASAQPPVVEAPPPTPKHAALRPKPKTTPPAAQAPPVVQLPPS